MRADYDFPVSLQTLYTKDQLEVPQVKAVIREDTQQPIAAVSSKYGLIPHNDVFEEVEGFMSHFGKAEVEHAIGKEGAEVIGTYTFKDSNHLKEVALGDTVGLRVYVRNSYNTNSSLTVHVGALVLSCLNGMVSPRNTFAFRFRHTKNVKISLPEPDDLLEAYYKETDKWENYGSLSLTTTEIQDFLGGEKIGKQLPTYLLDYMGSNEDPKTAWDLMQNATNFVTHQSPKLGPLGKFNRLEAVSRIFDNHFLS